jgi:hypothetical protein
MLSTVRGTDEGEALYAYQPFGSNDFVGYRCSA